MAQVVVLPDSETLARAVATAVLVEARRAVRLHGRFGIALSGGSTPQRVYQLLGGSPLADEMPWGSTHVFWSDERCVDPSDIRSNQSMAREAMLDCVTVPAAQVHPVTCGEGTEATSSTNGAEAVGAPRRVDEAASAYESLLREYGSALDLVLLGLGEDGHTASLFPGSEALNESERWVVPALGTAADGAPGGADPGEVPLWRVTLTLPYINRAASVFFVVSGAAKARALEQVLSVEAPVDGPAGSVLPAQLIRPSSGGLTWFVDREAASLLHGEGVPRTEKESLA